MLAVSAPVPERTSAERASVTARAIWTNSTTTPVRRRARGSWTRKVRTSIDALWR
jgi:hypothetical protein